MIKVEKLKKRKDELKAHSKDLAALTAAITADILGDVQQTSNPHDPVSVIRTALKNHAFRSRAITEVDIADLAGVSVAWVNEHCPPGLIATVWLGLFGDKCSKPRHHEMRKFYEDIAAKSDNNHQIDNPAEIVVESPPTVRTGALKEMPDEKTILAAKDEMRKEETYAQPPVTREEIKSRRFLMEEVNRRASIALKDPKERTQEEENEIRNTSANRRDVRCEQASEVVKADLLARDAEVVIGEDAATRQMDMIRKGYVFAKPGQFPSLIRIMQDLGLMDKSGHQTPQALVTLEEVFDFCDNENWRSQRRDYIMRINDFIEEERMVHDRQIVQRMKGDVENQFLVVNRLLMNYWRTGDFRSLEGAVPLRRPPSLGDLMGLAETYRRLVEGNALIKQNIYMNRTENNNTINMSKDTPLLGSFIQAVRAMTPEQALQEASRLESIASMLSPQHSEETEAMIAEVLEQGE